MLLKHGLAGLTHKAAAGGATSIVNDSNTNLGTGTSDTITSGVASDGFWVLVLGSDDDNASAATVTFNAVSPDGVVNSGGSTGGNVEIHYMLAATAGNVVITTTNSGRYKYASLYKLVGYTTTGLVSNGNTGSGTVIVSSVPDGAAVIAGGFAVSAADTDCSFTGSTEDNLGVTGSSNIYLSVASGVKSGAGDLTITKTGSGARDGIAAVGFPVA